jgi:hypothetical protein
LAGVDPDDGKPSLVHYTLGLPSMPGYENGPWAREWKLELAIMDATRGNVKVPA